MTTEDKTLYVILHHIYWLELPQLIGITPDWKEALKIGFDAMATSFVDIGGLTPQRLILDGSVDLREYDSVITIGKYKEGTTYEIIQEGS